MDKNRNVESIVIEVNWIRRLGVYCLAIVILLQWNSLAIIQVFYLRKMQKCNTFKSRRGSKSFVSWTGWGMAPPSKKKKSKIFAQQLILGEMNRLMLKLLPSRVAGEALWLPILLGTRDGQRVGPFSYGKEGCWAATTTCTLWFWKWKGKDLQGICWNSYEI